MGKHLSGRAGDTLVRTVSCCTMCCGTVSSPPVPGDLYTGGLGQWLLFWVLWPQPSTWGFQEPRKPCSRAGSPAHFPPLCSCEPQQRRRPSAPSALCAPPRACCHLEGGGVAPCGCAPTTPRHAPSCSAVMCSETADSHLLDMEETCH